MARSDPDGRPLKPGIHIAVTSRLAIARWLFITIVLVVLALVLGVSYVVAAH
jgi:hypothetical protein